MRGTINFLDKFSGVIGSLIIFWSSGNFVYKNVDKAPKSLLLVITLVAVLFLAIFIRQLHKWFRVYRINKLESDIKKKISSTTRPKEFSPNDILTTRQIKNWLEVTDHQAREWSRDAEHRDAYQAYTIRYSTIGGTSHWTSVEYYSQSKGETMSLAIGGYKDLTEVRPEYKPLPKEHLPLPFYINQPRWREGVITAYHYIEDKWDDYFEIFICTIGARGAGLISISCSYTHGRNKVGTGISFTFDGKFLFNDGVKIEVK